MKHVLMLAMLALVGLCLSGCGTEEPPTEEPPTVDISAAEPSSEPTTVLEVGDTVVIRRQGYGKAFMLVNGFPVEEDQIYFDFDQVYYFLTPYSQNALDDRLKVIVLDNRIPTTIDGYKSFVTGDKIEVIIKHRFMYKRRELVFVDVVRNLTRPEVVY